MAVALRFGNFFLFDCTHILEQSAKCFQNPQHIAKKSLKLNLAWKQPSFLRVPKNYEQILEVSFDDTYWT